VAFQEEMGDRLRVVKVDVQAETDLARRCTIGAVPILLLYRAGEELHRIVGARGLDGLRSEVSPFLA
jgi:thioredoxin-like negative regulator of GroEL